MDSGTQRTDSTLSGGRLRRIGRKTDLAQPATTFGRVPSTPFGSARWARLIGGYGLSSAKLCCALSAVASSAASPRLGAKPCRRSSAWRAVHDGARGFPIKDSGPAGHGLREALAGVAAGHAFRARHPGRPGTCHRLVAHRRSDQGDLGAARLYCPAAGCRWSLAQAGRPVHPVLPIAAVGGRGASGRLVP